MEQHCTSRDYCNICIGVPYYDSIVVVTCKEGTPFNLQWSFSPCWGFHRYPTNTNYGTRDFCSTIANGYSQKYWIVGPTPYVCRTCMIYFLYNNNKKTWPKHKPVRRWGSVSDLGWSKVNPKPLPSLYLFIFTWVEEMKKARSEIGIIFWNFSLKLQSPRNSSSKSIIEKSMEKAL